MLQASCRWQGGLLLWWLLLILPSVTERVLDYRFDVIRKGGDGISDRRMVISALLKFAVTLNATLSFPRPCQSLTHRHSKEFPECKYDWDYYLSVNTFFYGYFDGIPSPNCTQEAVVEVTPEFLQQLDKPPVGDNLCFVIKLNYWWIHPLVETATHRLVQRLHLALPEIVVQPNPNFATFANQLLVEYHLQPQQYHAIKVRRLNYPQVA